jgi:Ribosomal silencing factor during starvation
LLEHVSHQLIASFLNAVALALANIANEVKAEDIRVLYVKPLVYWTRFFIIATAFSNPQINAIGYNPPHLSNFDYFYEQLEYHFPCEKCPCLILQLT